MPDNTFYFLRHGKPFVYQVGHDLYYIGLAVFRPCTAEECKLFETYRKEVDKVHHLPYTPNENDVKELVAVLDEILEMGNVVCTDAAMETADQDLCKFFSSLKEGEEEKLMGQHDDFVEALDYKDGAFYRHSKD